MAEMTVVDWLRERKENCIRIAAEKSGDDKAGWLSDAAYFERAIVMLSPDELAELPEATDAEGRRLPYIARRSSVLQGPHHIALARSKTMAKRISNALNKHKPNDEGV
jgi:hypothetical protein